MKNECWIDYWLCILNRTMEAEVKCGIYCIEVEGGRGGGVESPLVKGR